MSVLKHRHHVEAPPDRPRAVPAAPLPPLPLGAPARSVGVMADLRAADRAMGMQRPAAPRSFGPNRYTALEYTAFVSMRIVANEYDAVADEIETALAELAELAPFTEAVAL